MNNKSIDWLTDSALLIYILDRARPIQGRIKLQKTFFLAELELRKNDLSGLHFRYFRHNYGPFSKQLIDLFDFLAARGFVRSTSYDLTDRGQFILDLVETEIKPNNRSIFNTIDKVSRWCKHKSGNDLMGYVYEIEMIPDDYSISGPRKIKEFEHFVDLICPEPGGIKIQQEIAALIEAELCMTDRELEEAKKRLPKLMQQSARRLADAIGF